MAAPKCPNPQCEYFNRTLPNTAQVCPMCGTALGNVVRSGPPGAPNASPPVPTPYQPAQPVQQPAPPAYSQPAYQQPAQAYPPAAAQPVRSNPNQGRPALKLVHTTLGHEYPVHGEESFIGRRGGTVKPAPEIDLTGIPNDQVISRPHAHIYWDATYATYTIIDSSRNGTFINGQPLDSGVPYQLVHGDLLQLGKENLVQFSVSIS